jgi:hypothetical protein
MTWTVLISMVLSFAHAVAALSTTYDVYIASGWTILPDQFNAATVGPTVSLQFASTVPSNVTWNTHQTVVELGLSYTTDLSGYDDPLGLTTLVDTAPLTISSVVLSVNARVLNITFVPTLCYLPKQDNVLYLLFGFNATNVEGAFVAQVPNPGDAARIAAGGASAADVAIIASTSGAVAVRMSGTPLDKSASADGLIIVGLISGCCALTFLLGNWFDALFTLMQLQLLVLLCFTPCSPETAAIIFDKSVWVLWPLSTHSTDVTNPEDQGRMLFNFIFIAIMLVMQGFAVILFAYFSSHSRRRHSTSHRVGATQDPRSRVKFPQGTLFVAGFLFQGSAMSCVKTFALHYLGFLGNDVAGPLALAIFTCIFLIAQLVAMWIVVFNIVSQQVFHEPLTKSFFVFAFLGGSWANADVRKQWGVLFDGVNGSSFWFFASTFTLSAVNSMLAGFVPGSLDSCTTVYYLMLVVQVVQLILVFVRRPFKSVAQNVMNIIVTILQTIVCIAFVSAMECSRMQSKFSSFSVWFTLVALFLKGVMSCGLQIVIRAHRALRAPLRVPLESTLVGVSPERHNNYAARRRAIKNVADMDDELAMQLLQDAEAEEEERSVLYPLDNTTAAADHSAQKVAAMWKPLLPQPILLGSAVVSREVGFGGPGGLSAAEGPSIALKLSQPSGMCCDAENLYLLDSGHHRILSHSFSQRRSETLCGGGRQVGGYAGDLSTDPSQVAMDAPRFIAIGHRVVYVSDTGNDCVRRVDLASGQTVTIVGGNVAASTSALSRPMGLQAHGQFLYIADSGHHRLQMYDFQENIMSSICGTGYPGYDGDGVYAAASRLNNPQGLCIRPRDGTLFIADTGNHRVVRVDPDTRRLHTVIGTSGRGGESLVASRGDASIQASTAQLCFPTDVACGPEDSLLVVDGGNAKIWIVNRFGFARVILPATDNVIPRHICVPKAVVGKYDPAKDAQGAAQQSVFGQWGAVKSGTPLTTMLATSTTTAQDSSGSAPYSSRQQQPTAANFVFFVSDTVQHMVLAVDASSSRSTVFSVEKLYTMAHPESAVQMLGEEKRRLETEQYAKMLLHNTAGSEQSYQRFAGRNRSASVSSENKSLERSMTFQPSGDGADGWGERSFARLAAGASPIAHAGDETTASPNIKYGEASWMQAPPAAALKKQVTYERPVVGRSRVSAGASAITSPLTSESQHQRGSWRLDAPAPPLQSLSPHGGQRGDSSRSPSADPRIIPRRLQVDAPKSSNSNHRDMDSLSSASSDESWL